MFKKILIANRGEIACRVIRTARRMGVKTVAVYSDADVNALHVELADEAVCIGAAPSSESYLVGDKIVAAAQRTGAEAIHPGYGFLSENAEFAASVHEAGLIFIGPPAPAISAMGSKSAAKRIMQEAGVPLVPGYHGEDQSLTGLQKHADDMGYPVLLKAVAGGGGKGMRQVWNAKDFKAELTDAKREAKASFGSDDMLVEKYLTAPRHVEVQIFFDQEGNGVYLFERDCSVQRRHQKVIEEAPAPGLSETLRHAMGEAAVQAGRAINYQGAGTVEFLLDTDGRFYFMEMNTRLQVEHPVTEMITGQDLVEWQLRVAAGEPLPCSQEELNFSGSSIEVRIYAEDAFNGFLPTTGSIEAWQVPELSANVRLDTGVRSGDMVSPFYDPMIAKLVVWGESREQALEKIKAALSTFSIKGLTTNLDFLYRIAAHPSFRAAELDTSFIATHENVLLGNNFGSTEVTAPGVMTEDYVIALASIYLTLIDQRNDHGSASNSLYAWRLNQPREAQHTVRVAGQEHEVAVRILAADTYCVSTACDNSGGLETYSASLIENQLRVSCKGYSANYAVAEISDHYVLYTGSSSIAFEPVNAEIMHANETSGDGAFKAPMNGNVVDVLVKAGQSVEQGELLIVMEAMKMQHAIKAPVDGIVSAVYCTQGELVDGGTVLLEFEVTE